jgi:NADH-quinone oxidoreductase subunit H
VSYELPLAVAIAAPLLIHNSLSMRAVVESQNAVKFGFLYNWTIFSYAGVPIVAFVLFLICAFAETNRIPFDLPEAENELVAGFHTEYSSMKFASFFMAEYANMTTICCLAVVLFLGGWLPPIASPAMDYVPGAVFALSGVMMLYHGTVNLARARDRYTLPIFGVIFLGIGLAHFVPFLMPILVPLFWFLSKVLFLLFLYIWVRATLPRFRYDQLMRFAWGWMFPVSIGTLFAIGLLVAVWK